MRVNKLVKILNVAWSWSVNDYYLYFMSVYTNFEGLASNLERIDEYGQILNTFFLFQRESFRETFLLSTILLFVRYVQVIIFQFKYKLFSCSLMLAIRVRSYETIAQTIFFKLSFQLLFYIVFVIILN